MSRKFVIHTCIWMEVVVAWYAPGICSERLRKTTINLNQDTRSPGSDLNLGRPEYKAGVITTRPRHSVMFVSRTGN
jgi:hypothetical protein